MRSFIKVDENDEKKRDKDAKRIILKQGGR